MMNEWQPNRLKKPFLSDIQEIRRRARQHMEQGAVTDGYKADLKTVLRVLNEALATEIVCVLRYKRHQFMASGLERDNRWPTNSPSMPPKSKTTPTRLPGASSNSAASRILTPRTCSPRSHSEYVEGTTLVDMIQEDLVAERIAIESYSRDHPIPG